MPGIGNRYFGAAHPGERTVEGPESLLENPRQPLLVLDQEPKLRRLTARDQSARAKSARAPARRAGGRAVRA